MYSMFAAAELKKIEVCFAAVILSVIQETLHSKFDKAWASFTFFWDPQTAICVLKQTHIARNCRICRVVYFFTLS